MDMVSLRWGGFSVFAAWSGGLLRIITSRSRAGAVRMGWGLAGVHAGGAALVLAGGECGFCVFGGLAAPVCVLADVAVAGVWDDDVWGWGGVGGGFWLPGEFHLVHFLWFVVEPTLVGTGVGGKSFGPVSMRHPFFEVGLPRYAKGNTERGAPIRSYRVW